MLSMDYTHTKQYMAVHHTSFQQNTLPTSPTRSA